MPSTDVAEAATLGEIEPALFAPSVNKITMREVAVLSRSMLVAAASPIPSAVWSSKPYSLASLI